MRLVVVCLAIGEAEKTVFDAGVGPEGEGPFAGAYHLSVQVLVGYGGAVEGAVAYQKGDAAVP
jgi:hypothetical protein